MKLRQQIREKDAMIDNLLSQVNPGPTMPTPLTLVPARLPLSQKERGEYRDVLAYLERAAQQAGQRCAGDGRAKFDISALEDVVSDDEDEEDEVLSQGAGAAADPPSAASNAQRGSPSPKRERGPSPKLVDTPSIDPIWEAGAPTGLMAQAALQQHKTAGNVENSSDSASSQSGPVEAGVAGDLYFLPGASLPLPLPSCTPWHTIDR